MIRCLLVFCLTASCLACSQKKKEKKDTSDYFPILSYLQSQVKDLDTSLYPIIKIETVNGISDTTDISREEVRNYAKEFLNIPDITKSQVGGDYTALTNYDSLMGRVYMSYTAYDKDVEVVKQEVTIMPTFGAGKDEVKTIYIEKIKNEGDSTVEKKMLWEMKNYFNIRSIIQKQDGGEKIHNLKVQWKDPSESF